MFWMKKKNGCFYYWSKKVTKKVHTAISDLSCDLFSCFLPLTQRRYISLLKHRHPPSSSIETPFPCLYNCTVGSWQLYRQTATTVYCRQSSYTDREKSHIRILIPFRVFFSWFIDNCIKIFIIFSRLFLHCFTFLFLLL